MKPKRGKKKRTRRARAGAVEVAEPSKAGATVATTDAEPDQDQAEASAGDDAGDASADAAAARADGAPAEREEAPVASESPEDEHEGVIGAVAEDDAAEGEVAEDEAAEDEAAEDEAAEDEPVDAGDDRVASEQDTAGDAELDQVDEEGLAAQAAEPGSDEPGDGEGSDEPGGEPDSAEAGLARRKGILESLLFASDKPLSLKRMSELMHERQLALVREALDALLVDYQGRGIEICEVAGGWQFRTSPANSQWVQQLVGGKPVRLSRAQLETLAIVAYRQPITRPEIDEIRGVDSGGTLKVLLDRSLIRVLGKKEEPGRPLLYGTTKDFLTFFNLNDLRELPTLREYHELTEDSRRVVEARLGMDLDDLPGRGEVAIDAGDESLADELAADLGLASRGSGQSSEDGPAGDEEAPAAAGEEWAPEADEEAVGEEWAPEADEEAPAAGEEWAPEADEEAPAEAGEEAPEASEEWAPGADEDASPAEEPLPEASDDAFAAGEGESWVDDDATPADEDRGGGEVTDEMDAGGAGESAGESEDDPQRASPEDGSATHEEG